MATVSYKCINCGGPLKYDPEKLKFSCEYCQSVFSEETLKKHFGHLDENLNNAENEEKTAGDSDENGSSYDDFETNAVLYQCPSCGAEIITDSTTAATFCVYCHSPVVLAGRLSGRLKPQKVIPFRISENEAKERFREMCKKKWFLPSSFISDKQLENMKGVYYPYWLVDALKDGEMHATAKKIRTWRQGDEQITETKVYRIYRAGKIDFRHYPKEALSKESAALLKYVNPYDDAELKKFSMTYLSGFMAEKRDRERTDLQEAVNKDLLDYAAKVYKDTVHGYTTVSVDNVHLNTLAESWEYALLPVWVMVYKFRNKSFIYAMNGQTGKVFGELPCSMAKLLLMGGIVAVAVFLLIFFGGWFMML